MSKILFKMVDDVLETVGKGLDMVEKREEMVEMGLRMVEEVMEIVGQAT